MTISLTVNKITTSLDKIKKAMAILPRQAFVEWVKETPVKSGLARRKTKLHNKTIVAAYPYAQRLDQGYSSQSPEGMSAPTEKFIAAQIRKILRK